MSLLPWYWSSSRSARRTRTKRPNSWNCSGCTSLEQGSRETVGTGGKKAASRQQTNRRRARHIGIGARAEAQGGRGRSGQTVGTVVAAQVWKKEAGRLLELEERKLQRPRDSKPTENKPTILVLELEQKRKEDKDKAAKQLEL
ncbi:hypothetical protein ACA910_018536 [Epithemia clementina (nom. ined.)]